MFLFLLCQLTTLISLSMELNNRSGFSSRGSVRDVNLYQMIRVLHSQKKGLHVCHINAQSLKPKLDELRLLFISSGVDILCVSETWFFPNVPDVAYKMDGYELFRGDRIGRVGGGVAVYLRDGLRGNIVCKSNANSSIDYLFLDVTCGLERLLLGVIYRPNKHLDISPIFNILQAISCSTPNIIISGDLNCNLLNTYASAQLIDSFKSIDLTPVNVSTATHFAYDPATLLDVFFVNHSSKIMCYSQLTAPGFSKHDLIYLTYDILIDPTDSVITYRDFKNIDYQSLRSDVIRIQWDEIYLIASVNQQVLFLENNIKSLFDKHVPLRRRTPISNSPPWLNRHLLDLMQERNIAYARWKRHKLPVLHNSYRSLRNLVVLRIRDEKRRHYEHLLNPETQTGKMLWQKLRKLGNGKQRSGAPADVDCNILNSQFVSVTVPSTQNYNYPWPNNQYSQANDNATSLNFTRLTDEDVVEALLSVKSNAIGLDEINPKFLKLLLPFLLKYITHIFNQILTTCDYPSSWKKAKIIPIPKSQNRINTEYRPIAILPFLSKAFEKAILKQMQAHLSNNNLLSSAQSGFRAKRSCKTALLLVVDDIRKGLDANSPTFLTLLDFSKAFDTVDYSLLCQKLLHRFRFSHQSVKLLHSYLTDRQQCVAVGNIMSSFLGVPAGVPQGSILGPILFSIYVNELPQLVKNSTVHMFADDVQLFMCCPLDMISSAIQLINEDLEVIQQWALKHNLSLNPSKSKTLCIYKHQLDTSTFPPILLGQSSIEYVHKAKNLGIIFNDTLTWTDHVAATIGKVYNGIRLLWSTQSSLPTKTKMLLVKSLLLPILLYGCEVFCHVDYNTRRKLNVIYNSLARYIFKKRFIDHISSYSLQIMGLTFDNLIKFRTLILLHGIMQTQQPEYLYNRLSFASSQRTAILIRPRFNCLQSERTFFVHATLLWNSLPIALRRTTNTSTFKNKLFKHLASDI